MQRGKRERQGGCVLLEVLVWSKKVGAVDGDV